MAQESKDFGPNNIRIMYWYFIQFQGMSGRKHANNHQSISYPITSLEQEMRKLARAKPSNGITVLIQSRNRQKKKLTVGTILIIFILRLSMMHNLTWKLKTIKNLYRWSLATALSAVVLDTQDILSN